VHQPFGRLCNRSLILTKIRAELLGLRDSIMVDFKVVLSIYRADEVGRDSPGVSTSFVKTDRPVRHIRLTFFEDTKDRTGAQKNIIKDTFLDE
jgi:hypothetical protein